MDTVASSKPNTYCEEEEKVYANIVYIYVCITKWVNYFL